MKKVMFLFSILLIGGVMLSGCKKITPKPEPTSKTFTMVYRVADTFNDLVMSPCFKLDVTYTDANGQSVTETNCTLPWEKTVEITPPFHAKMEGTFTYDEAELPDPLVFGRRIGIGIYKNDSFYISMKGGFSRSSKQLFLNLVAEQPERLNFILERDF